MPDDYTDTRNGTYDAVTPVGKEPYFLADDEGHLHEVWENPIPLRLARKATPPLNPRTGRNPSS